jgi:hypothetical protein
LICSSKAVFVPEAVGIQPRRWCVKCDKNHVVKDGEVWAAFYASFLMRRKVFYTFAFGKVYNVTAAAALLGLQYRVAVGAHAAVRMPLVPEGINAGKQSAKRRTRGSQKRAPQ